MTKKVDHSSCHAVAICLQMSDEIDALLSDLECLSEAQTGPATIKFAPHPPPRSNENQISNPKLKYIRPELSCVSNGGVDAVLQYGQSPDLGSKLSNIVTSDDEEDDKLLSSFSPTSLNMILQTQSPKNNGSPIKNICKTHIYS